jgi:hypothetical protein
VVVEIRHIAGKTNVVADRLSRPSDDLKPSAKPFAELYAADVGGQPSRKRGGSDYVTRAGRRITPAELFGDWEGLKRARTENRSADSGEVHAPGVVGGTPSIPASGDEEGPQSPAQGEGASELAVAPTGEAEQVPSPLPLAASAPEEVRGNVFDLCLESLTYSEGEVRELLVKGWIRQQRTKVGSRYVTTTLWGRQRDGVWVHTHKPGSVLIPHLKADEVLHRAHQYGHPGRDGLLDLLRHWGLVVPGAAKRARRLVCEGCMRSKGAYAPRFSHVWHPKKAWQSVVMDFMEPERGFAALVVLDRCTGWVEAYPVRSMTTREVISCVMRWVNSNAVPEYLQTDNGEAFVSRRFQAFLWEHNINHVGTAVYHPHGQGDVERKIRHLLEATRAGMKGERGWDFGTALGWAC